MTARFCFDWRIAKWHTALEFMIGAIENDRLPCLSGDGIREKQDKTPPPLKLSFC
jgi:hypothetical protein